MTTPGARAAGKSTALTPTGPHTAEPNPSTDGRSAPESRRPKGVPSVCLPESRSAIDGRTIVGGLRITAPRGAVPTATSWCACGRDRSAVGHRRIAALVTDHTHHRTVCPHHVAAAHRRNVA
ncbi:hypothetical protein [Streptomyces qinzhouensis]|uniref:Uncharacterized protein n=1 Tax=Streptomyces qinzhouensis TaxID=2599401 RepID=A0A5B8IJG7_9ACTN|nr:hypothetical protein [Streptomyces qinzhouensis]QDY77529.1 hypothetical protein FQU76_14445 [Streptomyces qinzhouensis]